MFTDIIGVLGGKTLLASVRKIWGRCSSLRLFRRFLALGEERKGTASNPPGQLPSIQVATRCDSFEQGFRVAEVYAF